MLNITNATAQHAHQLAFLINLAGEGIPAFLWQSMCEGSESVMQVGAKRAAREEGAFSYTNARMCLHEDDVMGMILAYRQDDPYEVGDLASYPDVVRPLIELEAKAPGSWYINAIATYEKYRGQGVGRALMDDTEKQALKHGCETLSLIVASENKQAKRLYEYLGFEVNNAKPVVSYPGCVHSGDWLLMLKRILK